MRIDLVRQEEWEELNEALHSELKISAKNRARAYTGMAEALYEVAQGTAQFMTHKKSVAFVSGQTPLAGLILPYYYKETYDVRLVPAMDLETSEEAVDEFVKSLKADTAFVLVSEDHPVTGRRFPFVNRLNELLNAKRIITIRLSHFQHHYETQEILPYSVRVCSWGEGQSVAILGERFRSPALLAHGLSWNKEKYLTDLRESVQSLDLENKESVLKFESQASQWGARAYLESNEERTFDRAVLVFEDINTEYLKTLLEKKISSSNLLATSLCALNMTASAMLWWQPQPLASELRGMLLIRATAVQNPELARVLEESVKQIRAEQSWEVKP